ncbi:unnamed protein product [Lasius platythorax]|uniref:Uncharacterized protein n=1 Tax=Lasius platythorax TaxID=488582 RepID=A0AAV2P1A2_9HYME
MSRSPTRQNCILITYLICGFHKIDLELLLQVRVSYPDVRLISSSISAAGIIIKVHSDNNIVITAITTWKISTPPTDIPTAYPAYTTSAISDCATPIPFL